MWECVMFLDRRDDEAEVASTYLNQAKKTMENNQVTSKGLAFVHILRMYLDRSLYFW